MKTLWRIEQRYVSIGGDIPARISQVGASDIGEPGGVEAVPVSEPRLGSVSKLVLVFRAQWRTCALENAPRALELGSRLSLRVVALLDDVIEHETIAVPRDRPDELRILGSIGQAPSQRSDRLCERAVRNDDVAPDLVEDLVAAHRLAPSSNEQYEQIEIAGYQRNLAVAVQEEARSQIDREVVEPIAARLAWLAQAFASHRARLATK